MIYLLQTQRRCKKFKDGKLTQWKDYSTQTNKQTHRHSILHTVGKKFKVVKMKTFTNKW